MEEEGFRQKLLFVKILLQKKVSPIVLFCLKFHQMFMFASKTLHHVSGSAARTSVTYNFHLFRIHPLSSPSLKSVQNSPNLESFTVNYLVNSYGFSPEKAISASKRVKFEDPQKPDSVILFFKNHGFTQAQVSSLIRKAPWVLVCDTQKTLLPTLEFLKSKGLSSTDLAYIVSSSPSVLKSSLTNTIIPSFNFVSNLFESEEIAIAAIKRYAKLLVFDQQTHLTPRIQILRKTGVPNSNVLALLLKQPRVFMRSIDSFGQIVLEVEKMGFNPLRMMFLIAVHTLSSMNKSTWRKKINVYKSMGWTEDEILVAFKKFPLCMTVSEGKIIRVMDFLVNEMGVESSLVARRPIVISLSLKKRIVPRFAVYQLLLSKGLIKTSSISLQQLLESTEKQFLNKFINCYEEEAPELLKLYKEKLDLAKRM